MCLSQIDTDSLAPLDGTSDLQARGKIDYAWLAGESQNDFVDSPFGPADLLSFISRWTHFCFQRDPNPKNPRLERENSHCEFSQNLGFISWPLQSEPVYLPSVLRLFTGSWRRQLWSLGLKSTSSTFLSFSLCSSQLEKLDQRVEFWALFVGVIQFVHSCAVALCPKPGIGGSFKPVIRWGLIMTNGLAWIEQCERCSFMRVGKAVRGDPMNPLKEISSVSLFLSPALSNTLKNASSLHLHSTRSLF